MEFVFTTLGIGSASPTSNRYPSAHVLKIRGRLFLIDCGEGCQMLMKKHSISILKIEAIFVSHLHGDHIFGIFGLLSTMAMMGRTATIKIFAPEEFGEILKFFLSNFGTDIKYDIEHIPLNFSNMRGIFSTRTLNVSAFPLRHKISTFGFIFKEKEPPLNVHKDLIESKMLSRREICLLKSGENIVRENGEVLKSEELCYKPYNGRSFAYCADTTPFETLPDMIRGVDLLYHEATFADNMENMAEITMHSTSSQAAKTAKKGEVKRLVIGHFSSRYPDLREHLEQATNIFKNTELAQCGREFVIPFE